MADSSREGPGQAQAGTPGPKSKGVVKTVATSAAIGASRAGMAGAATAGAKALATSAVKSSRGKAIIAIGLAFSLLPFFSLIMIAMFVSSSLAPLVEDEEGQQQSVQAVQESGAIAMGEDQDAGSSLRTVMEQSERARIPWQVVMALGTDTSSLGGLRPSGPIGSPPQGMTCAPVTGAFASVEKGLQPHALFAFRCAMEMVTTSGLKVPAWHGVGSRALNSKSKHPRGLALDVMITSTSSSISAQEKDTGWKIANWMTANMDYLGISDVIWDAKVYTSTNRTWRAYRHPSGATDPTNMHKDHVHVSFNEHHTPQASPPSSSATASADPSPSVSPSEDEKDDSGHQAVVIPSTRNGWGPYNLKKDAGLSQEEAEDYATSTAFVTTNLAAMLNKYRTGAGIGLDRGVRFDDSGVRFVAGDVPTQGQDATGSPRSELSVDPGQADGDYGGDDAFEAAQVRATYVAAIKDMPIDDMSEERAEQVYDMALAWYLGKAAGLGGTCQIDASGLPETLTARGAKDEPIVLNDKQIRNAAIIIGQASAKSLPQKAVIVALMTAMQETRLLNLANDGSDKRLTPEQAAVARKSLDYPHEGVGHDWDSVGLFQQRPATGWGSAEELMQPDVAAGKFFDALAKVGGWEQMDPVEAAQAVQRSKYPDAYAKWANLAIDVAEKIAGGTCAPAGGGPVVSAEGWTNPLPGGRITSRYSMGRVHPIFGRTMPHLGTDIAKPMGTPILAAQAGTVVKVGGGPGRVIDSEYGISGWMVAIDHGGGIETTYNHMAGRSPLHVGQKVSAGQVVGNVGNSGISSGPHLHFGVRQNKKYIDAEPFMKERGVTLGQ